jgi:prepilin-type N-terminal cleavage/methylation domain-containing protein
MRNTRYNKAFTLVELLVAMTVTSVILAAVATLAYALGAANDSTDDTSRKQAQLRYTTLRVSQLIRHCRLVCFAGADDFALWRADDNDDGQINISELVYVEKGASGDHLRLCEFDPSTTDPAVALGAIDTFASNWWSAYCSQVGYTVCIPQCSNVQFGFDLLPTETEFVSISFDLVENDIARTYEISASVRGRAGNLLNEAGDAIVSDDD